MTDQFERTRALIGEECLTKLFGASVMVVGLGGVGGFVCEGLARAGVGKLIVIDADVVDITNINRQIIANHKTVGMDKALLIEERIKSINPNCEVVALKMFVDDTNIDDIDFNVDYVVDAIDSVKSKILLIEKCKEMGIPVISSMGTAKKLDSTKFIITDISKTSVCPLAKVMRRELKNRGIKGVKVLYSQEEPVKTDILGSISFVPSVAGLMIAGEVIKDLIKED